MRVGTQVVSSFLALTLGMAVAPTFAPAQDQLVVPRLQGEIRIDGAVDEPAWEALEPLGAVMQTPTFGNDPSERTEFRLAYDDDYLYFSCRNYDLDVGGIQATSLRRDDGSFSNDWCVINIDTFNDNETVLVFGMSPAGIRTDVVFTNDGESSPNFTWSTFWDGAVRRTGEGWFAEMRIPFSSLRFQDTDGRVVMGVILWRRIARKNEMITFPAIPPQWGFASTFKASRARDIVLDGVFSTKPLYVTPYALGGRGSGNELNDAATSYDPFDQTVRETGLDVKYGIMSNLTLDLTANTDFAQVEADDQQVNLTRFSLFFPEKRLFFQERATIFDYSLGGVDRLFYSRRIGLVSGEPVRIYGGARVVGRVGRWDIGMLDMHTAPTEGTSSENFGVLRLRRQVFNENSYLGGIVTSRVSRGGDYNVAYGLDGIIRLLGQEYLSLKWSQTFDQEDVGGVSVLDRSYVSARWERRGVDGLTYSLGVARAGAAYDPRLGFLRRDDFHRVGDRITYGWRPGPESVLLRHALSLMGSAVRRNADGAVESARFGPQWELETKDGHTLTLSTTTSYEDLDDSFDLSDDASVPVGSYTFQSVAISYGRPAGSLFQGTVRVQAGRFFDGRQVSGSISPTWNVSPHLQLRGSYSVDRIQFPDRDQEFTVHLIGFRPQIMVNHKITVSGFVQYSSEARVGIGNLRVRYNPREGTDLYLVYNEGWNADRFRETPVLPRLRARTFLVKYSYTFNLKL